jgi:hypothetical protein
MAVNPIVSYPAKVVSDSDYSYGKARDVSTPGDGSGTPWIAKLINDLFGMQQAMLDHAVITPSNISDTASLSEYFQAFQITTLHTLENFTNTFVSSKTLSQRIGAIRGSDEISVPYASTNLVYLASGGFRNVAPGYNPITRRETALFIIHNEATKIIQVENSPTYGIQVQTELAITLSANHVPDSLCCDGEAVYILCHSAATGTAAIVYKFAWSTTAPYAWSSTPVWSQALSSGIRGNRDGSSVIKVADSTRIVVLMNGTLLDTGIPALAVLLKSTGAETNGSGNHVAGATIIGGAGLCISGGNIWFTTEFGTSSYINGAQITNPTLAPTGYTSPQLATTTKYGWIESNGFALVMPEQNGNVDLFYTTGGPLLRQASFTTELSLEDDELPPVAFDGQRFWTFWESTNNSALVPVDVSKTVGNQVNIPAEDYTWVSYPWLSAGATSDKARMCFSDGCLWLIPDANTSHNSIYAQRIPRMALRY